MGASTDPKRLDDALEEDGALSKLEKKDFAGGLPAGVVEPSGVGADDKGKKPPAGGAEDLGASSWASLVAAVSGDSGSATIEPEARGEEERGRLGICNRDK